MPEIHTISETLFGLLNVGELFNDPAYERVGASQAQRNVVYYKTGRPYTPQQVQKALGNDWLLSKQNWKALRTMAGAILYAASNGSQSVSDYATQEALSFAWQRACEYCQLTGAVSTLPEVEARLAVERTGACIVCGAEGSYRTAYRVYACDGHWHRRLLDGHFAERESRPPADCTGCIRFPNNLQLDYFCADHGGGRCQLGNCVALGCPPDAVGAHYCWRHNGYRQQTTYCVEADCYQYVYSHDLHCFEHSEPVTLCAEPGCPAAEQPPYHYCYDHNPGFHPRPLCAEPSCDAVAIGNGTRCADHGPGPCAVCHVSGAFYRSRWQRRLCARHCTAAEELEAAQWTETSRPICLRVDCLSAARQNREYCPQHDPSVLYGRCEECHELYAHYRPEFARRLCSNHYDAARVPLCEADSCFELAESGRAFCAEHRVNYCGSCSAVMTREGDYCDDCNAADAAEEEELTASTCFGCGIRVGDYDDYCRDCLRDQAAEHSRRDGYEAPDESTSTCQRCGAETPGHATYCAVCLTEIALSELAASDGVLS